MSLSTAFVTWQNLNASLQQTISSLAYFASIAFGFTLWGFIALGIYKYGTRRNSFFAANRNWWMLHITLSIAIAFIHLLIDTFTLWMVFNYSFDFLSAYTEKILRWLPYELMAYWGCLSIFSLIVNKEKLINKQSKTYRSNVIIKNQGEELIISVKDIEYIESMDNYVVIHEGQQKFIHKETMKSLEASLDPKYFFRNHRSYLVNLLKVDKLLFTVPEKPQIKLKSGAQLNISRRRKLELKKKLDDNRIVYN